MKKSKKIMLTFLTGTTMLVVGCGEASSDKPITSVNDCINKGGTQTECLETYKNAQAEHLKTAPKFQTKEDCVKEFGEAACISSAVASTAVAATTPATTMGPTQPGATPAPQQQVQQASSGGFFFPMMIGYWMGGGFSSPQPVYNSNRYGYVTPQSFSRGSSAKAPPNAGPTKSVAKSNSVKAQAAARASSRGGFGSSARASGGS